MKTVSRSVFERFGREISPQPVSSRNGFYDRIKRHGVIRGGESVGIAEIYLVLTGTLLMMRAFRPYSHLLKRQTYLAADVFALVVRRDIHISRLVVWRIGFFPKLV